MIRLPRKRILIPSLLLGAAGLLLLSLFIPVNPGQLYHRLGFPYRFYDRYGNLIHEGLSSNGFLFEPVKISEVPIHTVAALVLLEDRRFFSHAGIDLRAVGRAFLQRLEAVEGTSGASTLTMQLARNVFAWPRNIFAKMVETWFALRVERTFSKLQILEHYFNTIPFGKRIIGIQSASRHYFNKPVGKLSPAQGAFLAALVRFPSYANTVLYRKQVRVRQIRALRFLRNERILDGDEYKRAVRETISVRSQGKRRIAPHFTDMLLDRLRRLFPDQLHRIQAVYTTLDSALQRDCEKKAGEVVRGLTNKRISNAAVVLLDNSSGELRALVGSIDYSGRKDGQVNGAAAIRSPGSTLKPFIYASALENGAVSPSEVIPDVRTDFYSKGGDYVPENYSRTYHGPVSLRQALACSYNIPAVRLLRRTGIVQVLRDLRALHFDSLDRHADWYGLTLALGGGNVNLLQLTAAYQALARGGTFHSVRMISRIVTRDGADLAPPDRKFGGVYSRETAFIIGDILADNDARTAAFTAHSPLRMPFFCAAKTGTSKGFRDNWTIGYTKNWTLGVWVGNFDNSSMEGISGITGAAPLFRRILLPLEDDHEWRPEPPAGLVKRSVCAVSGKSPAPACSGVREEWILRSSPPLPSCPWHVYVPYRNNGLIVWKAGTNHRASRLPGVRWKRVEVLPDEYREWFTGHGHSLPGTELVRYLSWLRTGERPGPVRPRVVFPDDGDIFAVDPILERKQQMLTLRASIDGVPEKVFWLFNGTNRIPTVYPWNMEWVIRRGTWHLQVEAVWNGTNRLRSKPVFFRVY